MFNMIQILIRSGLSRAKFYFMLALFSEFFILVFHIVQLLEVPVRESNPPRIPFQVHLDRVSSDLWAGINPNGAF